jgi:septum site-determining protein MinC
MEALASYEAAVASGNIPEVSRARGAFDLKGVMSSLTVLRLKTRDLGHIEKQLRLKVTQFPQFFRDAPVVIDMGELEGSTKGLPLAAVAHLLRACKVVPVAVIGLHEDHKPEALAAGLGVLPGLASARPARAELLDADEPVREATQEPPSPPARAKGGRPKPAQRSEAGGGEASSAGGREGAREAAATAATPGSGEPAQAAEPLAASLPAASELRPGAHRPPVVVRTAVRSGQVIYAQATDLIVLAPVNPGAQLIADGHIHVYATLRGRAMAGASGYGEARIFCHRLEAEMLSVAGAYVMADDIPSERWGKAVQVHVENGECRITPL